MSSPADTATSAVHARLACVAVELSPDEREAYDHLSHELGDLTARAEDHRSARKGAGRLALQREQLLHDSREKQDLHSRLNPASAHQVLMFASGTVEDPNDPSYDGRLDDPRRMSQSHQVFVRGTSEHTIDAFLTAREWVPDPVTAPSIVPPLADIAPVVVHNVLPTLRVSWRKRRKLGELIRSDELPPFVRLTLPRTDLCPRCGAPVGFMRYCVCPIPTVPVQGR